MMDEGNFEKISKTIDVWYEGVMVMGTNILLKWEMSENMARPQSASQEVYPEFVASAPRMYKGALESLVRRMITFSSNTNNNKKQKNSRYARKTKNTPKKHKNNPKSTKTPKKTKKHQFFSRFARKINHFPGLAQISQKRRNLWQNDFAERFRMFY